MKLFAMLIVVAVATGSLAEDNVDEQQASVGTRGINDNLIARIKQLQEKMYTGDEELGIPVMDPLNVESRSLSIDEDLATLNCDLSKLTVHGLAGFSLDTVKFSLIGIKFTFAFTWPTVKITTGYDLDGKIAKVMSAYGTGDLDVTVSNLTVSGVVNLSTKSGKLYIRSMTSAVALEALDTTVTGLLDADDISALASAVVTDMAPQVVVDFQNEITTIINTIVTSAGNLVLADMTLDDLLGLISG